MNTTITLHIKGMDCSSCVINIDGILEDIEGVHDARTNFAKEQSTIRYDHHKVSTSILIQTISKMGYTASIAASKS
jgi:copper chaperone CopZ